MKCKYYNSNFHDYFQKENTKYFLHARPNLCNNSINPYFKSAIVVRICYYRCVLVILIRIFSIVASSKRDFQIKNLMCYHAFPNVQKRNRTEMFPKRRCYLSNVSFQVGGNGTNFINIFFTRFFNSHLFPCFDSFEFCLNSNFVSQ